MAYQFIIIAVYFIVDLLFRFDLIVQCSIVQLFNCSIVSLGVTLESTQCCVDFVFVFDFGFGG